jgi:parallel beta-helix repeat protein
MYRERRNGIDIRNTSVHFILNNIWIKSGLYSKYDGIYLENVQNAEISNCTLEDNKNGIHLVDSSAVNIDSNKLINNRDSGIWLNRSSYIGITNNNASRHHDQGIYLVDSSYNSILVNEVNKSKYGIYLRSSHENTIIGNRVNLNSYSGVYLESSSDNSLESNVAESNKIYGFYLESSSRNSISYNLAASNKRYGFYLESSSENNVTNNNLKHGTWGIYFKYSDSNSISENEFSNNGRAMTVSHSQNSSFKNNIMIENGMALWGDTIEHWNTHDIDTSNLVNDKPIHYWKDRNGGSIPVGAGQVILANCENILVENQTMSFSSVGIELGFSSNNTILKNNISSAEWSGITLYSSQYNIIANNNLNDNDCSVTVWSADNNLISENQVSGGAYPLYFLNSSMNAIRDNNISNSAMGVQIDYLCQDFIFTNNTLINSGIILWDHEVQRVSSHKIDQSNTVNGMPVYYWKNRTGGVVPQGAGQVILANCTNVTIENQEIEDTVIGIHVICSQDISIVNNTMVNNTYSVIHIWNSSRVDISNNSLSSSFIGFLVYVLTGGNISNNNLSHNLGGILMVESEGNKITDNTFYMNEQGISIQDSHNNSIFKNTIEECNNTGIIIHSSSSGNTIAQNQVQSGKSKGIMVRSSTENTIINNNISFNEKEGIDLREADNNSVVNNYIFGNNESGIEVFMSSGNILQDNRITGIQAGIHLSRSATFSISGNLMIGGGIDIYGNKQEFWDTHSIDDSNIVNNKPLFYWKNQTSGTVPSRAGQVILANCSNVEIKDQFISDTSKAIILGYSKTNNLTGNTLYNNSNGIYIYRGKLNNITGNIVSENDYGLYIEGMGINNIIANNITKNEFGLYTTSSGNILHHNNFVENKQQINPTTEKNIWDNNGGVGNYWSDYEGLDDGSNGRAAGDGIGDTKLPHQDVDDYPLVEPADITRYYEIKIQDEPSRYGQERGLLESEWPKLLLISIFAVTIIIFIMLSKRRKKLPDKGPGIVSEESTENKQAEEVEPTLTPIKDDGIHKDR